MNELQLLIVPAIVLAVAVALFMVAILFARNYIKVSPNVVAVLSGRKRKLPDGRPMEFVVETAGAALPLEARVEIALRSPVAGRYFDDSMAAVILSPTSSGEIVRSRYPRA